MNTPLFIGLLVLAGLIFQSSANAAEYLLIPKKTRVTIDRGFRESIIKRPEVIRDHSLFSEDEKAILVSMGKEALAESWVLEIESQHGAHELMAFIQKSDSGFVLEENTQLKTNAVLKSDSLENEQWGLNNRGRPQKVDIDFITTREVPGVVGEDVRLPTKTPINSIQRPVTVAVLDTGLDLTHPDLKSQIAFKESECKALAAFQACTRAATAPLKACEERTKKDPDLKCAEESQAARTGVKACETLWAKVDSDGNGYPLDCNGWSVPGRRDLLTGLLGNNTMDDSEGHGTHVAGIIAASLNGTGVRGVAPQARILPVKVIEETPTSPVRPMAINSPVPSASAIPGLPDPKEKPGSPMTFTDIVARGMLYAIRSNADVINMSLGWPGRADSQLMNEMIELAQSRKILIVASAGNDSTDSLVFPCQHRGVVCVGAHGPDGKMSHFSNFGSGVEIAAPGLRILSTIPLDQKPEVYTDRAGFDFKDGTSMATPFVSGALAILLSTGMSPEEAYARLLAGARPQPALGPMDERKSVIFGNLDIQKSLSVSPKPVIVSTNKGITPLLWNRHSSTIQVPFELQNIWESGVDFTITTQVSGRRKAFAAARVITLEEIVSSWAAGEVKKFEVTLEILDQKLPSDLEIEVQVSHNGGDTRVITLPLQISVPIYKTSVDHAAQSLLITGNPVSPRANLRSVTALDGISTQDYLAIEKKPQWKIQLIKPVISSSGDISEYAGGVAKAIDPIQGDLLQIQRLDVNLDGKSDYILVYTVRVEGSRIPAFRFDIYDDKIQKISSITYPNDSAVLLLNRFQWFKVGKELVPAWVVRGATPPLEKPKYDVWKPNALDTNSVRFYYYHGGELHTVSAPVGYEFVDTLDSSPEQRRAGIVPVLLSKGSNYRTEYSVTEVSLGQAMKTVPVLLPKYRNFLGLNASPIINLTPASRSFGSAYAGTGTLGSQRVTGLWFDVRGNAKSLRAHDLTQRPHLLTSSVVQISGTFMGDHGLATYAIGSYDLSFKEENSSRTLLTTLRRYSFVPSQIFGQTFFPIVVGNSNGALGSTQERVAAMIIPDRLGAHPGTEVIVPTYDNTGQPEALLRPARLRFQTAPECDTLGNPIAPDARTPSQVMFYCGDRFIRMPLQF